MPLFDFLRRPKAPPAAPPPPVAPVGPGVPFDCCTEDWRIRGRIAVTGRLLDSLNRREVLDISDAEWVALEGSTEFHAVPGLKSVDPYDVLVVFASAATMPGRSQDTLAAHRRSKNMYDVILEVPPFHVVGTVHLYPGLEPSTLLDHATDLYVAVTGGVVLHGTARVGPDEPTTVLVNRSYLTRIDQVDDARRHQADLAAAALAARSAVPAGDAGGPAVDLVGGSVPEEVAAATVAATGVERDDATPAVAPDPDDAPEAPPPDPG